MELKEKFNNLQDYFNLNLEHKKGLTELLLIVGSLVVAFNSPENLKSQNIAIKSSIITLFFLIFAFFSIIYFILIQTEINKKRKLINDSSFIIASFFSVVMAIILAISTIKDINNPLIERIGYLLVLFVYWLPFTFFIWSALRIK